MTQRLLSTFLILFLIGGSVAAQDAANADIKTASDEAVRRQAWKIELQRKLVDGQTALQAGDFQEAALRYDESVMLVKDIGYGVDVEAAQAMNGFTTTRLYLARQAKDRGDLLNAEQQVARLLKEAPENEVGLLLSKEIESALKSQAGRRPSPEVIEALPEWPSS